MKSIKLIENQKEKINFKLYEDEGSWHKNLSNMILKNGYLIIKGMITGCGIVQAYGVTLLTIDDKDKFIEKTKELKKNGVGAIVCTLGQNFFINSDKILLKIGFEFISEYNNYRHCPKGTYKQRLYIYTIE